MLVSVAIYALYHVANYAHAKDTTFGRSKVARIFIIIGETIYLVAIVYVPVDVELKTRGDTA